MCAVRAASRSACCVTQCVPMHACVGAPPVQQVSGWLAIMHSRGRASLAHAWEAGRVGWPWPVGSCMHVFAGHTRSHSIMLLAAVHVCMDTDSAGVSSCACGCTSSCPACYRRCSWPCQFNPHGIQCVHVPVQSTACRTDATDLLRSEGQTCTIHHTRYSDCKSKNGLTPYKGLF